MPIELKTIVLFSRCELVHLYGQISKYLCAEYSIIHLAYSDDEELILRQKYNVKEVINFSKEVFKIFENEKMDNDLCNLIDNLIIKNSNNRFSLNSSIQSDRTFEYLTYNECLVFCQTYYKFWNEFLLSWKIDYLLHEPNSLFFNQIASILCRVYKANYITQIQVYGIEKLNFLIVSSDDSLSSEITNYQLNCQLSTEERERVRLFLDGFRASYSTFFSTYSKKRDTFMLLLLESAKILRITLKNRFRRLSFRKDTIDPLKKFFLNDFSFISEIRKKWSSYFLLKYDIYNKDLKYYYYPIHLEPESVVLYWGDGIYKNQVKLIENIAAQLPPNCYLFVKDHPHAGTYRDFIDYSKIKAIPNVRLLNPGISGKTIIKNCIGLITINGTSGFEALLLNKQVYTFGNSYYNQCPRVNFILNIRDLRRSIYTNINKSYEDDETLFNFVSSYLKSTHPGFTDYFSNYVKLLGINEEANAHIVAKGLIEFFQKLI